MSEIYFTAGLNCDELETGDILFPDDHDTSLQYGFLDNRSSAFCLVVSVEKSIEKECEFLDISFIWNDKKMYTARCTPKQPFLSGIIYMGRFKKDTP